MPHLQCKCQPTRFDENSLRDPHSDLHNLLDLNVSDVDQMCILSASDGGSSLVPDLAGALKNHTNKANFTMTSQLTSDLSISHLSDRLID